MSALDALFAEAEERGCWDTGPARREVAALHAQVSELAAIRDALSECWHRDKPLAVSVRQVVNALDEANKDRATLRADLARERERALVAEHNLTAPCDRCGHGKSADWRLLEEQLDRATRQLSETGATLGDTRRELGRIQRERDEARAEVEHLAKALAEERRRPVEAGETRIDALSWRARCLDAETALVEARQRTEAHDRDALRLAGQWLELVTAAGVETADAEPDEAHAAAVAGVREARGRVERGRVERGEAEASAQRADARRLAGTLGNIASATHYDGGRTLVEHVLDRETKAAAYDRLTAPGSVLLSEEEAHDAFNDGYNDHVATVHPECPDPSGCMELHASRHVARVQLGRARAALEAVPVEELADAVWSETKPGEVHDRGAARRASEVVRSALLAALTEATDPQPKDGQ